MAKFTIHGITMEQAEQLASWYILQGSQQAEVYFEINNEKVPQPNLKAKNSYFVDQEAEIVRLDCSPN